MGDETVEVPRRSTRLRACPGCLLNHNHHTWGIPDKNCKGPLVDFVNAGSKNAEAFDVGLNQSSGLGTVGSGDDFQRKHGIPDFEFNDFGISCLTPGRNFKRDYDLVNDKEPESTKQIEDSDGKNKFDEKAILCDCLQQLQIRKHSWLKKKRIADLKRQIDFEE